MKNSWDKIQAELNFEKELFQQTKIIIQEFSKQFNNQKTIFYAFAFDLEIEQGHLSLCLNDLETLNLSKEEFENELNKFSYEKYDDAFNTGNWKYQSFNKFDFPTIQNIWDSKMKSIISSISEYYEAIEFSNNLNEDEKIYQTENLHKGFILSIQKVIERMKNENIFECLNHTKTFKIYFLEFNDDLEDEEIKEKIRTATNKA